MGARHISTPLLEKTVGLERDPVHQVIPSNTMRRPWGIAGLSVASLCVSLVLAVSFASAAPILQYSQDGTNYRPIVPLASSMKASDYYNYSSHAGHPAFGVQKGSDTVCLYWDTTRNALSMLFISGGSDRASGTVSVTGLPLASQMTLSDDPGKFKFDRKTHTLTGRYSYQNSTDGFVMSGLDAAAFDAKLKLSGTHGIQNLRLTVGDPNDGGAFQPLFLQRPLFFRTSVAAAPGPVIPIVGTTVPEPTGFSLLGLIAMLLFAQARPMPRHHV